ncbi:MAG TPA: NAD(P)/FAD-dependent oxidoreductase, partial [Thermomicrobiales bacterium]|nr:NAD(P)/FAD-dependent oxidoreductase [Thermomicrobiales bacterium]
NGRRGRRGELGRPGGDVSGRVHLLYRGNDLGSSMSHYLITRLEHTSEIQIHTGAEVRELRGDSYLESILVESRLAPPEEIRTRALFVMIGADPCTEWVSGSLDLGGKGFILTGQGQHGQVPALSSPYQTSMPGVFAVGDVRSGTVKRVASAVGEGSVVVQAVHAYLNAWAPRQ